MFKFDYDEYSRIVRNANDLETIKKIVRDIEKQGCSININLHNSGNLLSILAPNIYNHKIIEYLVSKGFDVNDTQETGMTPLLLACYSPEPNRRECIQTLLKNGADPFCLTTQYKFDHPELFKVETGLKTLGDMISEAKSNKGKQRI